MLWHDPGIYKYVDGLKREQWERDIFDGAIAKVFMSQRRTSPHLDLIDWLALLASSGPSFPVLFQIRFTYLFDKESDILSACEGLAELVKDVVENTEADKCTRISATVTFLRLAPNLGEIDSVSLVWTLLIRLLANSIPVNSCVEMSVQAIERKNAESNLEDAKRALRALALFADNSELSC